jgi:hypothetical protein
MVWLRNGRPIGVVSKDAGHENTNVTYRTYQHVLPSERDAHIMDLFPDASSSVGHTLDTDSENANSELDLEAGQ